MYIYIYLTFFLYVVFDVFVDKMLTCMRAGRYFFFPRYGQRGSEPEPEHQGEGQSQSQSQSQVQSQRQRQSQGQSQSQSQSQGPQQLCFTSENRHRLT